jgi:hypothetical protein
MTDADQCNKRPAAAWLAEDSQSSKGAPCCCCQQQQQQRSQGLKLCKVSNLIWQLPQAIVAQPPAASQVKPRQQVVT